MGFEMSSDTTSQPARQPVFMRLPCPICEGICAPLDVVDFNKCCDEVRGKFLPLAGIPIYYFLCERCGFCFAPEFSHWSLEDFESRVYNSEYIQVDPDYLDVRPRANVSSLVNTFGDRGSGIRHLDYGGGKGLLSDLLCKSGWQSTTYDPFVDRDINLENLDKFDLITAYEVFEHVPDVRQLMSNLSLLLARNGVILFSTLLSDGNLAPRQRISWWYASPRNGHISLFSRKSLALLGAREGFNFASFSLSFHVFWRNVPPWAQHVIRVG